MSTNEAPTKLGRRLTALDSTFLYAESANSPLHIGTLLIFEGQISLDDLLRHVERRIHLLLRYRQRLAEVPLNLDHPTLEEVPFVADCSSHPAGKNETTGRASRLNARL